MRCDNRLLHGLVILTDLTDLTVEPYDRGSVRVVALPAGASDALLVGEHQNRPDLPLSAVLLHATCR